MSRGLFAAFEGIDGCGKSTQLRMAAEALRAEGLSVDTTREPGGTRIAERVRDVVMSVENGEMTDGCEVLLYLASRAQHVAERIRPALQDGTVVLCDRFADATMAYQGYGRGIGLDVLGRLNEYATGGLTPHITFVFDITVALSRERLSGQGRGLDRMERSSEAFYERVRRGYLSLAAAEPGRFVVLDGAKRVEEISAAVLEAIHMYFRQFST